MIDILKSIRRKKRPRKQYFTEGQWESLRLLVPHLDLEEASIAEIIYSIEKDIKELPTCEGCDKKVEFNLKHNTYKSYCSKECRYKSPNSVINKMKNTLLDKYGVDNSSKIPGVVEKREKTFIDRYGENNPMKVKEIQEKAKETMRERYGVDFSAECKWDRTNGAGRENNSS